MKLLQRTVAGWARYAVSFGLLAAGGGLGATFAPEASAASSAVVVMYHRFGESKYPSTNTTIEQLDAHIDELKTGGYSVLPLPEIVESIRDNRPLPDRTVGISIDDAYRSVYDVAFPRFQEAGFPFTVFVATAQLDQRSSNYMTWDQVREVRRSGVTIGHQTVTHLNMPRASLETNRAEIITATKRLEKELGHRPNLFAYPYGETSQAIAEMVEAEGFVAAFGQHSGVIGGMRDMFYLPRFAMNEKYGDLARFRLAVNALPLPVSDFTPADPVIGEENPPAVGFTVAGRVDTLQRLNCFASHEGRSRLERLGPNRFEVRFQKAFPKGRTRLNCTLPTGNGRWRWLGFQFVRP